MMNSILQARKSNVAIFSKELHDQIQKERELLRELVHALHSDELYLDYQPIVSADKEMISMEALVRWNHPTKGMLSPSTFIPIAERSGLIEQVGEWVLRNVCAQIRSWQADG